MKYIVTWADKAQSRVTQAWLEADPEIRAAITQACNKLDILLTGNPMDSENRARQADAL